MTVKAKILIVDDEANTLASLSRAFRLAGHDAVVCDNAERALELARTQPFDLILSDVVMPQMSGPELAQRLAAVRPTMKILCMSGYTDDAVVRHGALEAGIAFIQKPFTPETLARKVREVLDSERGRSGG